MAAFGAINRCVWRMAALGFGALVLGAVFLAVVAVAGPVAAADGAAPEPEAYRLDAGDKVKVTVFGEDNLSGEFQVDGSGNIAMPLIGNVSAGGRSLEDLAAAIESQLKPRYLLNPRVSVELSDARPFYILGEVKSPGAYPYKHNMTVPNAIALAGGYTPRANTGRVLIRRGGKGDEVKYESDDTTLVMPGDIIRVRERFF